MVFVLLTLSIKFEK